ncbi:hypothetical protein AMAG_14893 [Allomyces macrogynus ATCC 38327]|uniref:Uncharacterized protein n=1 Tax=Allomyces macrogynus (strain ATCC 38327) TaxID=578462 RepID=A0A0L0T7R9_ALLM3|nr:hypothetical protein AMAG_14893 [Allomyces macrogynus ATCC 38327]|eukprot:KNE70770.1 hypothetical protein AMAG_14893 [Allomyces macrogynus ATCC 38327]
MAKITNSMLIALLAMLVAAIATVHAAPPAWDPPVRQLSGALLYTKKNGVQIECWEPDCPPGTDPYK